MGSRMVIRLQAGLRQRFLSSSLQQRTDKAVSDFHDSVRKSDLQVSSEEIKSRGPQSLRCRGVNIGLKEHSFT